MKDLKLKILSNSIKKLITKKTYTHIQAEYEYTYFSKKNLFQEFLKMQKLKNWYQNKKNII